MDTQTDNFVPMRGGTSEMKLIANKPLKPDNF
jgi:hypothetical protein